VYIVHSCNDFIKLALINAIIMKKVLKCSILLVAVFAVASCTSPQTNTSKSTRQLTTPKPVVKEYKGTIIHSDVEGDCEYVILLDGKRSVMLDPINLQGNFKQHGTKIWFTFRSMKMPNRCEKANPISITDIRTRTK
tara:strand:- start:77 stop:487 length:411 start_codon:yes stop_codon:yes gene_type:complete